MKKDTLEKSSGEKLGGVSPRASLVTPIPKPTPPKKHSRKQHGWIRGKKINGKVYYYYCWTERIAGGQYPEKSEYLGTAERIRDVVKSRGKIASGDK